MKSLKKLFESVLSDNDEITFTIKCTMKKRWVSHFLAMLNYMQQLGCSGSSREVAMFCDGDGDFRPSFKWDKSLPSDAKPIKDKDGDRL